MEKLMLAVAGAAVALVACAAGDLPAGYMAVDHIVAPKRAYIDTGYKPNQDTRVVMDVTVQGAMEYWFGCWTNDYNRGAFGLGNDGSYGIYYGIGDDGGSFKKIDGGQDGRVPDGRQTVEVTPWEFKVNAVTWAVKAEASRKDFQLDQPLYLFAQNRKGSAFVNEAQGPIVCHGCTISENGSPKRNFVPCVETGSWAAGLYDVVEGVFYTSKSDVKLTVPVYAVRVGNLSHMTAAYTFGDGSVTNVVEGTSFEIPGGMANLAVIFTAAGGYRFADDSTVKTVARDEVTGDLDLTGETPVAHKVSPTVTITKIANRYPWNNKIDVEYALRDIESSFGPIDTLITKFVSGGIEVTITNELSDAELAARTARRTYDCRELFGEGKRDAQAQSSARLAQSYNYAVIDISGGPTASAYPVTYHKSAPTDDWDDGWNSPNFWGDKIVLYYVKEGSYWGNQGERQTTTGF